MKATTFKLRETDQKTHKFSFFSGKMGDIFYMYTLIPEL